MFNLFKAKTYKDLSASEFKSGFEGNSNAVILDVRTPGEFASGKIKGAKNMDIMGGTFQQKMSKLDPNKEYYVYCRSGGRSGSACNLLGQSGFEKVYNLRGGVMGWSYDLV